MQDRILIVDDDQGVRKLLKTTVNEAGFDCLSVASGEEALAILPRERVTVVIADIVLPGLSGYELVQSIRDNYDADVIVITGFVDEHSYEEAIGRGAADFIVKPVRAAELVLRLKRVIKERSLRLKHSETLRELRELVIADSLTGLHNSRHFFDRLRVETGRSNRYSRKLSMLMLDIDYFKKYNDTYGHLAGDNVLARIGQLIKSSLRSMDSAYRYGGEEFAVLLPETSCTEAARVGERIRAAVEVQGFTTEDQQRVTVTVSIGATEYVPGESSVDFVRRADKAMYESKNRGRNRVSTLPDLVPAAAPAPA